MVIDEWVYIKIFKEIYGRSQAGKLAKGLLKKRYVSNVGILTSTVYIGTMATCMETYPWRGMSPVGGARKNGPSGQEWSNVPPTILKISNLAQI